MHAPALPRVYRASAGLVCLLLVTGSGIEPLAAQSAWEQYFSNEVEVLENRCLKDIRSAEDWLNSRDARRRELQEMLGLYPWPERTPLEAVITATHEHEDVVVENLHFQSSPGLYVTANLYRPRNVEGRLPAILYLCGHGRVEIDGVSYGNKVHYQHHGAWFARHGYVCLAIDTVQLGEIEGIHHGTYRYDMWWWPNRGYTPAGVEAWNGIRALDYLQSRPEVDGERIGVTGRSGGGAYTWWVAALDDRVQVAVPVAGITNVRDHVVHGCIEGHCDCMYFVNTYRWDFPLVAALVAPRPLLISNSDKDSIFPLHGVTDVYWKTRKVYELLDAGDKLGLNITEGPHKDTQELQTHAFRWFNRFLKNDTSLIRVPAEAEFEPAELKVFQELPTDERNTKIQESFVASAAPPAVPSTATEWTRLREDWIEHLRTQCFRGWPVPFGEPGGAVHSAPTARTVVAELNVLEYRVTTDHDVETVGWVTYPADANTAEIRGVRLEVMGSEDWLEWGAAIDAALRNEAFDAASVDRFSEHVRAVWDNDKSVTIAFAPRGIGPTQWTDDVSKQKQIRRRFQLIGQTWDAMQIWDVCQAIRAVRQVEDVGELPLTLAARGSAAGIALYAALAVDPVARLELTNLPASHQTGPELLNVLKKLDVPQALAMVAERSKVRLNVGQDGTNAWTYVVSVRDALEWPEDQFQWMRE